MGRLCSPSSRKSGMARVFAVMVQILLSITRVAPAPLLQIKSGGTSLIGAAIPIAIGIIPSYKFGSGHWRSVAVQTVSEPEICHGAGFQLRADAPLTAVASAKAGVRVQEPLQICLECRSKAKSGNNLPILSVLAQVLY